MEKEGVMHLGKTLTSLVTFVLLVFTASAWAFNPVDVNDQYKAYAYKHHAKK